MPLNRRVQPNTSEIAAEVIDGEAILINLTTGMYFSMDRTGALVWSLMAAGRSVDEIASTLAAGYQVDRSAVDGDLERLVAELLEYRLILVSDAPAPSSDAPINVEITGTYRSPTLMAYRDMGDLLALDPPAPGFTSIPAKRHESSGE
jgi:hypothetical protein